jgi:hypothetical protein
MTTRINGKEGSVLVLCLMVLAVLGVCCLWAEKVASLNRKTAFNHVRQLQSLYLAEAGIDMALSAIRENPLWRGETPGVVPAMNGMLDLNGVTGNYTITLYDATDDGNGIWDPRLAGGRITLFSEGSCQESYQSISCGVELSPSTEKTGMSPRIAIVTGGDITVSGGSSALAALDELGREDAAMIRGNAELPTMNPVTLKAMADAVFDLLDDRTFEERRPAQTAFWRDSLADSAPYITCISGDMMLTGDKALYGIYLVEGERVALTGAVRLCGVLYAPNAREVTIPGEDDSGFPSIRGQVIAAGDVKSTGGQMGVQLVGEYVEAFSDTAGSPSVTVSILPGSWHRP